MVTTTLEVSAFCICGAVLAVLLRSYCREQSMLTALAACIGVMLVFISFLSPVIAETAALFEEAGISGSYISVIFKAAAISFITQITCDICCDSGESAIASAAELCGRGEIIAVSLPLIKSMIERVTEYI